MRDCIAKAAHPEKLRFGIVEQISDAEERMIADDNMSIITIPHVHSQGACWARALTNTMYRGEEYVLQIDSHIRFMQDWDELLIELLHSAPSLKPVISTYPYMYWYDDEGQEVYADTTFGSSIAVRGFASDGTPDFMPHLMPFDKPLRRARSIAAGFFFTYGKFVQEVPYDDELYFGGEEVTLALRAFTNGWDIFHPKNCPTFHHYIRKDSPSHWRDNSSWGAKQAASLAKVLALTQGEPVSSCGLGTIRTLEEYQDFAGIDFKKQIVTPAALNNIEP